MPHLEASEIEIKNQYIRLYVNASKYLSTFMRLASVGEQIDDREYSQALFKVTDICFSSQILEVLTENELSRLESFKELLKRQVENE